MTILRTATILLLISAVGCVPNKVYRPVLPSESRCQPSADGKVPPDCSVQYVQSRTSEGSVTQIPVAFVEFDDVGQAYVPKQVEAAEKAISDEKARWKNKVVTVLFIHGWKNNAVSGNVAGFQGVLQQLRPSLKGYGLVGIYFAWRGSTTTVPVVQEFTYFNRRDTASYIPGSNLSEALVRVAYATKGDDLDGPSPLVVVGHSFGGLVLERTVTQYLTRNVVEHVVAKQKFSPLADLIVFVNEAAAATEGIQLLTTLKNHNVREVEPGNHPMIVSITSTGDTATGFILPVAQSVSLPKKSLRAYGGANAPDPFGAADQKVYYTHSAAHIANLRSHDVVGETDDNKRIYNTDRGYTCVAIPNGSGGMERYYVLRNEKPLNDTPYWIMQMPTQIVPDHSNIFRTQFAALLQSFVLRQAARTKPDPDKCYSLPEDRPSMDGMKHTFIAR